MGHRANLIIIDGNNYEQYYCHWCAKRIPYVVLLGPVLTLTFIRSQVLEEHRYPMHTIWAEGGILVDMKQQHVLLFGGEILRYHIPMQRLFLQLVRENWQGWTIEWAYDNNIDFIHHLANNIIEPKPMDLVGECEESEWAFSSLEKGFSYNPESFITLDFGDQDFRIFRGGPPSEYLCFGTKFLEYARTSTAYKSELHLDKDSQFEDEQLLFPRDGIHVNYKEKIVAFWAVKDPAITARIQHLWEGWELIWLKDNFEYQLTQAQGRLTFPSPSEDSLLKHIEWYLLLDDSRESDMFIHTLHTLSKDKTINIEQINPGALKDSPLTVGKQVKKQIFDQTLAKWRQRHSSQDS